MEDVYDVLIIGSGPAGLTAALYSSRYARKTCVIAEADGGTMGKSGEIENWPGEKHIAGYDLTHKIKEQVKSYGVKFVQKTVKSVDRADNLFIVDVGSEQIRSKTVIFALGTRHKHLEIPGEHELVGKGVSYCATCDGMFFKGKEVVVIGGSDSAAKAALYLADVAKTVKIIYRRDKLRAEPLYVKRIEEKDNIEVVYNSIPLRVLGHDKVEGVEIEHDGKKSEMSCDGFFIEIGAHPCNELTGRLGIECNENGYTKVNRDMSTSIPGAYATGDMTDTPLRQIITASADGAIAANSAHEYLQRLE